jgi:transcriptional regulator with XRE-family HTH domain
VAAGTGRTARAARPPRNDAIEIDTDEMLRIVGSKIRRVRQERQLTLETVANRTGLTGAMVSMVELGRVAPSFGTLVAIASALDIHMSDLFDIPTRSVRDPVTRLAEQPTFETAVGVLRRLVHVDDSRNLEFVINEYRPGTSNSATPVRHSGQEYGLLLSGRLTIELSDIRYDLRPGDSITYASSTPHRIINDGRGIARAAWLKLDSDRPPDAGRLGNGSSKP